MFNVFKNEDPTETRAANSAFEAFIGNDDLKVAVLEQNNSPKKPSFKASMPPNAFNL